MSDPAPARVAVSELAAFAGRSGNLGARHFSLLRGIDGIRTHQRVQQSRGEDYQKEVSLRCTWRDSLELFGRIDGVATEDGQTVIEEIKTTRETDDSLPLDHSVHRLQALIYAWMWWKQQGCCPRARLVYASPDTRDAERMLDLEFSPEELDREVDTACQRWWEFNSSLTTWRELRDASLRDLAFPHPERRPGQTELMEAATRTLRQGGRLYAQAATGVGKTLALLVPLLQAMGEGRLRKIFIASCRNTGKTVFSESVQLLLERGAKLRALTLEARERVCRNSGSPCDCAICPLALGFFDRLPKALQALRLESHWDTETWLRVAAAHELCPHAFLLNAIREADVLIGDLNYAFDPSARLEQWMSEAPETLGVLIDEAHHLPERSRDMLSARLDLRSLSPKDAQLLRGLTPFLQRVRQAFREYQRAELEEDGSPKVGQNPPLNLAETCRRAAEALELSFGTSPRQPNDPRDELYRQFRSFSLSVERRQPSQVYFREGQTLRSFCRDPAPWLNERFSELHALFFCSATLEPLPVFRRLTGALPENREIVLPSPFDPSRFPIQVEKSIPIVWKSRGAEVYDRLAARIQGFLSESPGKALVFLPSFDMLEEVRKRLPEHDLWLGPVQAQPRGLQEEAAREFLLPFRKSQGAVTGLAVLGGVLNEGIDLPGGALSTVVVVSIGLPAVTRERELLRAWYQEQGEDGFGLAYTVPGLVRVLQALGRVIRGPEDSGRALLVDPRFDHPFYRPFLQKTPCEPGIPLYEAVDDIY